VEQVAEAGDRAGRHDEAPAVLHFVGAEAERRAVGREEEVRPLAADLRADEVALADSSQEHRHQHRAVVHAPRPRLAAPREQRVGVLVPREPRADEDRPGGRLDEAGRPWLVILLALGQGEVEEPVDLLQEGGAGAEHGRQPDQVGPCARQRRWRLAANVPDVAFDEIDVQEHCLQRRTPLGVRSSGDRDVLRH
jgi:hypothetical protein